MPEDPIADTRSASLCEVLDRVLTKGVVVHGDITIAVADIDLLYLGLRLMLTSIETARNTGVILDGEKGLDRLCS
ncbi:MAG: gas vesicle protein [Acidobacteria bacterium]|nr:gas vesicle protein [Acidobacteriota bacterium]